MSDALPQLQLHEVNIGGVDARLMIATDDHLRTMVQRFKALMEQSGDGGGDGALIPDRVLGMMQTLETTYMYVIARLGAREAAEEAVVYNQSVCTVRLEMPAVAASAGDRFLDLLADADDYCRSYVDLADIVTPPEVAEFRTWFISQITEQLRDVAAD